MKEPIPYADPNFGIIMSVYVLALRDTRPLVEPLLTTKY